MDRDSGHVGLKKMQTQNIVKTIRSTSLFYRQMHLLSRAAQAKAVPAQQMPQYVQVPQRMFFGRKSSGAADIKKEVEEAAKAAEQEKAEQEKAATKEEAADDTAASA